MSKIPTLKGGWKLCFSHGVEGATEGEACASASVTSSYAATGLLVGGGGGRVKYNRALHHAERLYRVLRLVYRGVNDRNMTLYGMPIADLNNNKKVATPMVNS